MALTKKQVKQLRDAATKLNPLIQVGKNDLSENAVKQADETIEKRELIKCSVLDGSGLTAKEAGEGLAEQAARNSCRSSATVSCSTVVPSVTTWGTFVSCANSDPNVI